jgi:hypothetical protein
MVFFLFKSSNGFMMVGIILLNLSCRGSTKVLKNAGVKYF